MESKIYDYTIVGDSNAIELSRMVNQKITEGWQPFGNISTCVQVSKVWLFQPMVKR